MARTKEFNEAEILETFMALFQEKGYKATSIQDLEHASGLKRTSIYNAYGNKQSIFQKTLELYIHRVLTMLAEIIGHAPDPRQAVANWLNAIIDFQIRQDSANGCLVILSVLESRNHSALTHDLAVSLFKQEQQLLKECLAKGRDDGNLPDTLDCTATAAAITATSCGIVVLAMADFPETALRKLAGAALKLLSETKP